jgi:hypothetical protein
MLETGPGPMQDRRRQQVQLTREIAEVAGGARQISQLRFGICKCLFAWRQEFSEPAAYSDAVIRMGQMLAVAGGLLVILVVGLSLAEAALDPLRAEPPAAPAPQIGLTSRDQRMVHMIHRQCHASRATSVRSLGLCLVAFTAILFATAVHAGDRGFSAPDPNARAADRPTVLAAASLDDYVGAYKLGDNLLLKLFRMDDGLFAQASGQNAFPIFPSATDAHYTKVAGISISFTRDGKGIVTGLVLHQNGDHAARKLSASESPPEPVAIALDAATLGDYVGKYKFDFGAVLDVALKSDHLEAQLTGQPALPIFASAKDKFFYKVVAAQLDFERDGGQKVVAVVLHQNGRDMRAPRVGGQR